MASTRLLTLAGAGGAGKTRLATEVAKDLAGAYPDGAWMVELAPLSSGVLVTQEIASVLAVRELPGKPIEEALAQHLRDKVMLLLLDNCEHLLDERLGPATAGRADFTADLPIGTKALRTTATLVA